MEINKAFFQKYASRYNQTGYSEEIFNVGKKARIRKPLYFTKDEFDAICAWKLSAFQINKKYQNNENDDIIKITARAFADNLTDAQRFKHLLKLNGVGIPVASTLLTIMFPDSYAIIDQKAWKTICELGIINRNPIKQFQYNDWEQYISIIRRYAEKFNLTPRTIEKAFFALQWEDHKIAVDAPQSKTADFDSDVVTIIKKAFGGNDSAKIPMMKKGSFTAELEPEGISVDNLGSNPLLTWNVFVETVELLKRNGAKARKGNAMNFKLGDNELPLDSVEGHIASKIYQRKPGQSVFRRITPIAAILSWAGICENKKGFLRLRQ
jgi:hypothetical protein